MEASKDQRRKEEERERNATRTEKEKEQERTRGGERERESSKENDGGEQGCGGNQAGTWDVTRHPAPTPTTTRTASVLPTRYAQATFSTLGSRFRRLAKGRNPMLWLLFVFVGVPSSGERTGGNAASLDASLSLEEP